MSSAQTKELVELQAHHFRKRLTRINYLTEGPSLIDSRGESEESHRAHLSGGIRLQRHYFNFSETIREIERAV